MFNFGKKARVSGAAKEIQELILAQSVKFSGRVSQNIDTGEGAIFERMFTETDKNFYSHSHLDQMYTAIEGMAFFVHCSNRLSYRRGSETLRETIFNHSATALVEVFAKMLRAVSSEHSEQSLQSDILALVSQREDQYSEMPSLLGKDVEDKLSVWQAAGHIIAEEIGEIAVHELKKKMGRLASDFLELQIRVELLKGYNEMDLAPKIRNIENML